MRDQGSGVAADVPVDGVHVTPLAFGRAGRVLARGPEPLLDVDRRAELVAEQGEGGVAQGERRVEGD